MHDLAEMGHHIQMRKLTQYFLSVNAELFSPSACDRRKLFGGNKT